MWNSERTGSVTSLVAGALVVLCGPVILLRAVSVSLVPSQESQAAADGDLATRAETGEDIRRIVASLPASGEFEWQQLATITLRNPSRQWAFSANAEAIVFAESDGLIATYSVANGNPIGKFLLPADSKVHSLALTGDGQHVAIGDQKIQVYSTLDGTVKGKHNALQGDISFLAIADDDQYLLGSDKDSSVGRFPLFGGQGNAWFLDPERRPLKALAASADLKKIAFTTAGEWTVYSELPHVGPESTELPKSNDLNALIDGATAFAVGGDVLLAQLSDRFSLVRPAKESGTLTISTRTFSLKGVRRFVLTPDGECGLLASPEGQIELFDPQYSRITSVSRVPEKFGITVMERTDLLPASDCRTVALKRNQQVTLWRIMNDPLQRERSLVDLVAQLFRDRRHDLLTGLVQLPHAADPLLDESELRSILSPQSQLPADRERRVADLVAWRNAEAELLMPRLALCEHHYDQAWNARGDGFASTLSEEEVAEFQKQLDLASHQFDGFVPVDPTAEYFRMKLRLMNSTGATREEFDVLIGDVLKFCPTNLDVHCVAAWYLMPRWHGEPGDIAAYAERIISVVGEQDGKSILLAILEDQMRYYFTAELFEITGFEYMKLKEVLEQQMAKAEMAQEESDRLLGLYAGIARRAEDMQAVESAVARVVTEGWLARNKHHSMIYSDVGRTVNWLREQKGEGALYQGILKKVPPLPGKYGTRPGSDAAPPAVDSESAEKTASPRENKE